jgi:hypothetical protein
MLEKLNAKLAEIQENKRQAQESYEALTKQCEQMRSNFIALDGAEQVLLQLINEESAG